MRKNTLFLFVLFQLFGCITSKINIPNQPDQKITGTEFYQLVKDSSWQIREQIVLRLINAGNIPNYLRTFLPIKLKFYDSSQNKYLNIAYFVMTDYLSIGVDSDFMRIPMTPILAQQIADRYHCFLPTRKIVNDIYAHATIKISPHPLTEFRDSILTFQLHHALIEQERNGRKGLIAGIKKDIVLTDKIIGGPKTNKVAIYGWHKLDGKPIQPLYTGHVNWYVDYSHGTRLISRTIYINGKKFDYLTILKNPSLRTILSDEAANDFVRYPSIF